MKKNSNVKEQAVEVVGLLLPLVMCNRLRHWALDYTDQNETPWEQAVFKWCFARASFKEKLRVYLQDHIEKYCQDKRVFNITIDPGYIEPLNQLVLITGNSKNDLILDGLAEYTEHHGIFSLHTYLIKLGEERMRRELRQSKVKK